MNWEHNVFDNRRWHHVTFPLEEIHTAREIVFTFRHPLKLFPLLWNFQLGQIKIIGYKITKKRTNGPWTTQRWQKKNDAYFLLLAVAHTFGNPKENVGGKMAWVFTECTHVLRIYSWNMYNNRPSSSTRGRTPNHGLVDQQSFSHFFSLLIHLLSHCVLFFSLDEEN